LGLLKIGFRDVEVAYIRRLSFSSIIFLVFSATFWILALSHGEVCSSHLESTVLLNGTYETFIHTVYPNYTVLKQGNWPGREDKEKWC
jgi:hypothetical protein